MKSSLPRLIKFDFSFPRKTHIGRTLSVPQNKFAPIAARQCPVPCRQKQIFLRPPRGSLHLLGQLH